MFMEYFLFQINQKLMQESDNSKCDVTRDTCLGIVPFIDKREDCSRKCNNTELCADVTFNNGSQISILILEYIFQYFRN